MSKREKKERGFGWLILFLVIGAVIGIVISIMINLWGMHFPPGTMTQWINTYVITDWMWIAALSFGIIFPLIAYVIFRSGFKKAKEQVEREEEYVDEDQMTTGLAMMNLYVPIFFVFFALGTKSWVLAETFRPWSTLMILVGFVVGMLLSGVLQKKMIQCLKIIYPEKRGDAYSMRFQKDWVDSMDEREKMATYRAAYHAYRTVQVMSFIGLVGTTLYAISNDAMGWLIVMVLLNIVPTLVYVHYAKKEV